MFLTEMCWVFLVPDGTNLEQKSEAREDGHGYAAPKD